MGKSTNIIELRLYPATKKLQDEFCYYIIQRQDKFLPKRGRGTDVYINGENTLVLLRALKKSS